MGAFLLVNKKLELRKHWIYFHALTYTCLAVSFYLFFTPDPILQFHLLQDGAAIVMVP